jgi:hypothetical protein
MTVTAISHDGTSCSACSVYAAMDEERRLVILPNSNHGPVAHFSRLPPGEYTFLLLNPDGYFGTQKVLLAPDAPPERLALRAPPNPEPSSGRENFDLLPEGGVAGQPAPRTDVPGSPVN